jgi:hypothetical protein
MQFKLLAVVVVMDLFQDIQLKLCILNSVVIVSKTIERLKTIFHSRTEFSTLYKIARCNVLSKGQT